MNPEKEMPMTMKPIEETEQWYAGVLGLETSPDGLPHHLLIYDDQGKVIQGIDFAAEVRRLAEASRELGRQLDWHFTVMRNAILAAHATSDHDGMEIIRECIYHNPEACEGLPARSTDG